MVDEIHTSQSSVQQSFSITISPRVLRPMCFVASSKYKLKDLRNQEIKETQTIKNVLHRRLSRSRRPSKNQVTRQYQSNVCCKPSSVQFVGPTSRSSAEIVAKLRNAGLECRNDGGPSMPKSAGERASGRCSSHPLLG